MSEKEKKSEKAPGEVKPGKPPKDGNGHAHVVFEPVAAGEIAHRPVAAGKLQQRLHRRVDRSLLDYASYVALDRASPKLADGLKPVQRRILCALRMMVDG